MPKKAEDIISEIKARRMAKNEAAPSDEPGAIKKSIITPVEVRPLKQKVAEEHNDLKEVAMRIEGKK